MNHFTMGYIKCALWSSLDDSGEPLDRTYSIADISPDTLSAMVNDCAMFIESANGLGIHDLDSEGYAGHDFWLTRNSHGAGFWDGDWEELGEILTKLAETFSELTLYISDDGLLYT